MNVHQGAFEDTRHDSVKEASTLILFVASVEKENKSLHLLLIVRQKDPYHPFCVMLQIGCSHVIRCRILSPRRHLPLRYLSGRAVNLRIRKLPFLQQLQSDRSVSAPPEPLSCSGSLRPLGVLSCKSPVPGVSDKAEMVAGAGWWTSDATPAGSS